MKHKTAVTVTACDYDIDKPGPQSLVLTDAKGDLLPQHEFERAKKQQRDWIIDMTVEHIKDGKEGVAPYSFKFKRRSVQGLQRYMTAVRAQAIDEAKGLITSVKWTARTIK
jgi:hypothetical protein